jgi:hypothetical protein
LRLALALALVWPLVGAQAQGARPLVLEDGAPALANQRYAAGISAYQRGDITAAAAEFEVALALSPTSGKLLYNLARCDERLGRLEDAASHYERYLAVKPTPADHGEVSLVVRSLRDRLSKSGTPLMLTSDPTGARVFLNDEPTARGSTPFQTRVAPGTHAVRFELTGRAPRTRLVDVQADVPAALLVELQLEGAAPALVAATPTVGAGAPGAASSAPAASALHSASGPSKVSTDGWRRPAGWGLVAGGGVSLAVGTVFLFKAFDTQERTGSYEPAEAKTRDEAVSDLSTQSTVAVSCLALSAVLGGVGAWLLLSGTDDDTAPVSVSVVPGAALVQGQF